jgi:hypothetical protein
MFQSLQHGKISGLAESTVNTSLFVVFESVGETLWTVVEGIAKRLVDTLDGGSLSHEDLKTSWLVWMPLSRLI